LKENADLKENKKEPLPMVEDSTKGKESEHARFLRLITKSIETTIATDRRFCRWGSKRLGEQLVILVLDFKEGVSQPAIMKHAKTHLREYVFHPMKILRAMDLAGGTLGYAGYEIIRHLETDGENGSAAAYSLQLPKYSAGPKRLKKLQKFSVP
jgi:hypothetical protein